MLTSKKLLLKINLMRANKKYFRLNFVGLKKFDKTNLKSFHQCYQPLTLSQLALCLWVTHLHCHLACPEKNKDKLSF